MVYIKKYRYLDRGKNNNEDFRTWKWHNAKRFNI